MKRKGLDHFVIDGPGLTTAEKVELETLDAWPATLPAHTVVTNDFVAVNDLVIRYAFDLPGSLARLRVRKMHYVNPATGRVLGYAAKR
jgi:hypothetical protein